nr:HAMP domain-containing sensor histidine kinase [uncultured Cetobacterium sp.]
MENDQEGLEIFIKNMRENNGINILLMSRDGKKWVNSRGGSGDGFKKSDLKNGEFLLKKQKTTGAKILVYNYKAIDGRWVTIRNSLSALDGYKKEIIEFNIIGGIFAILISLFVSGILSKKVINDIEKLNHNAKNISNLIFDKNEVVDRNDELGDLGDCLENTSEKLKKSIKDLEDFVSDTSHELKTPISIISTKAQILMGDVRGDKKLEESCKIILKESSNTKKMISNLLLLSKMDKKIKLEKDRLSLKKMVEEILERYDYIEMAKNLDIDLDIEMDDIFADKIYFKIALENIIHNALKYSPSDEKIFIKLEKDRKLMVKNTFENSFDIEKILDPFNRGENTREEGSGLGLTIVKKILELNEITYDILVDNDNFEFNIYLS